MEGEALFNDASAITLFYIFFDLVKELETGGAAGDDNSFLAQLGVITKQTAKLAGGAWA